MDSVYWEILVAIRNQLRTNVSFQSFGNVPVIRTDDIQIRMPPPYGRRADQLTSVNTPGVLILPGRQVTVETSGGPMSLDDVRYPVSIQLVDTEFSTYNEHRMRSWLKWLEQIRKYVCHGNLKLSVMEDRGYVDILYCPQTDVLDEAQFYVHNACVGLITVVAESREPRDPLGTN